MRKIIPYALATTLFLLTSSPVAASLSLYPTQQELILESSQSASPNAATVTYQNDTDQTLSLTFSIQRIIATDLLGRLQFNAPLPQTLRQTDPDTYEINPNRLSINPGETATINATFDPQKLDPGTTAFLLLAETNSATDSAAPTNQAKLKQYLGSSILVTTLGGNTTKLELMNTSLGRFPIKLSTPDFIRLTLRNTGNTRTIPRGVSIITDLFGREIYRGAINEDSTTILPGSQRIIYSRLNSTHRQWPLSLNRLTVTGRDDLNQSQFDLTFTYLFIHPILAAVLILFPILLISLKKKLKKITS